MKLKLLIIITLLFTTELYGATGGAFDGMGEISADIFETIQESINNVVDEVASKLAFVVASLFGSIFGIYIMFKIIKALVDNQAKVILDIFVKEVPLLIIILFFLKNIHTFNKYVQKPIKDTYNNIGGYLLMSSEDNSSLLAALADSMKDVMNTLTLSSPSILANLIMCVLIIVVLIMLFVLFMQIFLTLIANYFKIMLPFAISPILLMFWFFKPLRVIPIKALNIMLDGIIKQAFLIITVMIMGEIFAEQLQEPISEGEYIKGFVSIVIMSMIYYQIIKVADRLSSELIGTQELGVNAGNNLGLLGAVVATGKQGILFAKGGVGGVIGKDLGARGIAGALGTGAGNFAKGGVGGALGKDLGAKGISGYLGKNAGALSKLGVKEGINTIRDTVKYSPNAIRDIAEGQGLKEFKTSMKSDIKKVTDGSKKVIDNIKSIREKSN